MIDMKRGSAFITLTEILKRFPSIGSRQAERIAYFLATAPQDFTKSLNEAITAVKKNTKQCPICFLYHEDKEDMCVFCRQSASILVVVEKDVDVHAIESSKEENEIYQYFVLGGLIPIAREISARVRIDSLFKRIETMKPKEIIIALSVHPDAEHTQKYLLEEIRKRFNDTSVSTLARGLSSGSELEYTSHDTLLNALNNRDKK